MKTKIFFFNGDDLIQTKVNQVINTGVKQTSIHIFLTIGREFKFRKLIFNLVSKAIIV